MSISGYVANDKDRNSLLRGNESMAGITMTLKKGAVTADPVETDARGFYLFENLEAGIYTVTAGGAANARAIHEIKQNRITKRLELCDPRPRGRPRITRLPRTRLICPSPTGIAASSVPAESWGTAP